MILQAIRARWLETPELLDLVDAERLVIGNPIDGWPVPSVSLAGYTRAKAVRTSQSRQDTVILTVVIESPEAEMIETIAEAITELICPVPVGCRAIREWQSFTLNVLRDETSQHYQGQLQITCILW
jgi:hypothetical protein